MKKKWKQLSRAHRQLVVISGLLNAFAFVFQFVTSFWLSSWLCGLGNGFFILFVLISFGLLSPPSNSDISGCPLLDCRNTSCLDYSQECQACILSQTPIDDDTLRHWCSVYARTYGDNAFCELISSVPVPFQEVSGNG